MVRVLNNCLLLAHYGVLDVRYSSVYGLSFRVTISGRGGEQSEMSVLMLHKHFLSYSWPIMAR